MKIKHQVHIKHKARPSSIASTSTNTNTRHSINSSSTKYNITLFIIPGSLLLVTLIAGFILSNSYIHAADNTQHGSAVAVTVNSSCTLKGGSDGTSTSDNVYSATVNAGTTQEITGSKLTAVCNDPNGYSLYAIGYSGDSYTTPTNTQMIGTGGIGNINTGTSGTSSSWWAMKINPVSGNNPTIMNSFNNYHVIPATYTQIAKYESVTANPTSTGAQTQTKYQVYISDIQPAGTYVGKVKYTMVHPNTAASPTTPITLDSIASGDESHTMQESIDCPNTTVGTVRTLTDSRDNQKYKVAKAADGNCWMIQNLKLGKTVTAQNPTLTLTPANSDVGSNYTLNYSEQPANSKFHNYTIDGTINQNNSTEYYCTDNYGCYYNWYTATAGTGTTYIATQGQSVNNSICPVGWTLPTGGSGGQFQALAASYNYSATAMLVDNPTTTTENTAGKVPGFLLGGNYNDGGAYNVGVRGYYWSRTTYDAQKIHYMFLNESSIGSTSTMDKFVGSAVRCLVQQ